MKWKVWNTAKPDIIYHIGADNLDTAIKIGREADPNKESVEHGQKEM